MKPALSVLLILALLLSLTACGNASVSENKQPIEGLTGIQAYTDFIDGLESGRLYKLHYSLRSWYEFCSSTSTVIRFNHTDEGKRELLYRERNPFVFWDFPPYDYYDGNTYYYKYKNNWFVDTFNKYNNVQKKDFIAIRDTFFTGNNVLADEVYHDGDGYLAQSTIQSTDKNIYYSLSAKLNAAYQFTSIRINAFKFNYETDQYEPTSTYLFYYTDINMGKAVNRPKDLVLSNVELSGTGEAIVLDLPDTMEQPAQELLAALERPPVPPWAHLFPPLACCACFIVLRCRRRRKPAAARGSLKP